MDRSIEGANDRTKRATAETSGADFLQLSIGAAPAGGKAHWLAGQLRRAIADGRLPLGARLPSSRVMAAELGVSRGVVTEAYQRLAEEGRVAGRGRNGTVVVGAAALAEPESAAPERAPRPTQAGALFGAEPGAEVFERLRAAQARFNLAPGVPDLAAFPRAAWLRAERAVLGETGSAELGYSDPRGAPAARSAIARWLARNRGIRVAAHQVLVVAGTAQALDLLAMHLRSTGTDRVAVEDPGSLGTRQQLRRWLAATPAVPVDGEGVSVQSLRATGASAVLLTPAHQFPTGVVLGGQRRRELVDWAAEGGLVIEDDYDAEHRYDRAPVPALHSLRPERVCYTGSVSKLLAPALRTGWVLAPPEHFAALVEAKRYADLGNPLLPQLVLARLMDSGAMERHLRQVRRRHRLRRDAMIEAIRAHLPGAQVHGAPAGLHLTVTFDAGFSDVDLAAAALSRGAKVQPLSWHRQHPGPPGVVLGYAACTPTQIAEGVAELGKALPRRRGAGSGAARSVR